MWALFQCLNASRTKETRWLETAFGLQHAVAGRTGNHTDQSVFFDTSCSPFEYSYIKPNATSSHRASFVRICLSSVYSSVNPINTLTFHCRTHRLKQHWPIWRRATSSTFGLNPTIFRRPSAIWDGKFLATQIRPTYDLQSWSLVDPNAYFYEQLNLASLGQIARAAFRSLLVVNPLDDASFDAPAMRLLTDRFRTIAKDKFNVSLTAEELVQRQAAHYKALL